MTAPPTRALKRLEYAASHRFDRHGPVSDGCCADRKDLEKLRENKEVLVEIEGNDIMKRCLPL
jgi:hypothetical protein